MTTRTGSLARALGRCWIQSKRTFSTHLPVTEFSEDERLIQHTTRKFAHDTIRPWVREMDETSEMRPEIIESLFENGYMGMEIPEEYGGSAMNFTSACLVVQELSRVDPSVSILVDIQNTLTNNAIRFWGSPDQQERYLPRLATDTVSSFCLSEANSGSDAFSLATTAEWNGSTYTIRGTKQWISNAQHAGIFLVFANVDRTLGHKGITAFVVDAETEGIEVRPPEAKLGLKASSTCSVTFQDVQVEASNVLGEVGMGYKYCIEILNEGRIGIAAQQLGIAQGCFDIFLPYIRERQQFGRAVGDFQGVQFLCAELATQVHAAETMIYNACRLKEANLPFVKEASMAKLFTSRVSEQVSSKAIEIMGGVGFTKDYGVEKFYRDCKVGSIYEGTSNIQLQTIAKLLYQ